MKKTVQLLSLIVLSFGFMSPSFANKESVDEINELLRGELSAIDTYQQALKKLGDEPGAKDLKQMLANHRKAAKKLSSAITKLNGTPSKDAGLWGAWSQTVVGSAKLLGDQAALKALKEGEEHGLKEYESALQNDEVPSNVKNMIKETFISQQTQHIAKIDQLINKQQ